MPPVLNPDEVVNGTPGDDLIDRDYVDPQGNRIDDENTQFGERGPFDDIIVAGEGNDTVLAGAGDDLVIGGPGDDYLVGGDGDDTLYGGEGDDTLIGDGGDDVLIGGSGNDLLVGNGGNNLMIGGGQNEPGGDDVENDGDNLFISGSGNDTMIGGNGDDTFILQDNFGNHVIDGGDDGEFGDRIISRSTEDLVVTYNDDGEGTIDRGDDTTVNFTDIERIDLSAGNDRVEVVSSTNGIINGGEGFDVLILPDPDEGEPAPVVTITETRVNEDGSESYFGFVDFPDGSRLQFKDFEEIVCFTPGTLIDTDQGAKRVEDLAPGDRVLTRDHGYRELVWTGRKDLPAEAVAAWPELAPVRIAAGALGQGLPARDLLVSPRHRMLLAGPRAEVLFGEREVLVAAADLVGLPGIARDTAGPVSYLHVMCEGHEIIRAEGAWTESFQPAAVVMDALGEATRAELLRLFPELATRAGLARTAAARPVLSPAEARLLVA